MSNDAGSSSVGRVVVYIAASIDGYIATGDDQVDWLEPYSDALAGFDAFDASVGSWVMGRKTYDFLRAQPVLRLKGRPAAVLTRGGAVSPLDDSDAEGTFAYEGPIGDLVARLRKMSRKDIWLLGGGETIRAFLEAGLVDAFRLFVIPVLLGKGVRLFPEAETGLASMKLAGTETFKSGVVELEYVRSDAAQD